MALYRDLHANPELSEQEVNTAAKLAKRLKALKFDVTDKVGGTGVVAVMKNGSGPVLLIRADMDALPVVEQTGLPFASKVRTKTPEGVETGVMHACGHDTHMTAFIETAKLLAAAKDEWKGTLVMILQPAEEVGRGARLMLEDGLYTRFPKPTHAGFPFLPGPTAHAASFCSSVRIVANDPPCAAHVACAASRVFRSGK